MRALLADLLCVLWVFAPAGFANMAPIFAARISLLRRYNRPLDFGKSFRGTRIFGDNKTWRGLAAGIVLATVVLALQQMLAGQYDWFAQLSRPAQGLDYASLPVLILGPLFAIGVIGGDAIESFFKRRVGVPPGKSWFPFDQTDFIIGAALAVLPFIRLTLAQYGLLLVLGLGLHLATVYIGWRLKIRDVPF